MGRVTLDNSSKGSAHGINPETMTIEQRLNSGFILLDKPRDLPHIKLLLGSETYLV